MSRTSVEGVYRGIEATDVYMLYKCILIYLCASSLSYLTYSLMRSNTLGFPQPLAAWKSCARHEATIPIAPRIHSRSHSHCSASH